MNCYWCSTPINESNVSIEHIIPNALGGKLRSKKLLCQTCNTSTGDLIDSKFIKKLAVLPNMLDIDRDSGQPSDITVIKKSTGKSYSMDSKGKPSSLRPEYNIENGILTVSSSSTKVTKQLLEKAKKDFPNLDYEAVNLERELEYFDEPLIAEGQQLYGDEHARGATKIAINYYLHQGGDQKYTQHIISKLKAGDKLVSIRRAKPYSYRFFSVDQPLQVCHSIYVKGDPKCKLLYAVVDLFSCCQYLILLSDDYDGEPFEELYSYDLIANEVVVDKTHLVLSENQIKEILDSGNELLMNNAVLRAGQTAGKAQLKRVLEMIDAFIVTKSIKSTPY